MAFFSHNAGSTHQDAKGDNIAEEFFAEFFPGTGGNGNGDRPAGGYLGYISGVGNEGSVHGQIIEVLITGLLGHGQQYVDPGCLRIIDGGRRK